MLCCPEWQFWHQHCRSLRAKHAYGCSHTPHWEYPPAAQRHGTSLTIEWCVAASPSPPPHTPPPPPCHSLYEGLLEHAIGHVDEVCGRLLSIPHGGIKRVAVGLSETEACSDNTQTHASLMELFWVPMLRNSVRHLQKISERDAACSPDCNRTCECCGSGQHIRLNGRQSRSQMVGAAPSRVNVN